MRLRRGWTTGACAAAAAVAAYRALLEGTFPDTVDVTLPGGQKPVFQVEGLDLSPLAATAAVVKGRRR